MAKSIIKLEARSLRIQGLSIKNIAKKLQVSSSTVSLWCRDIQLTENQKQILSLNKISPYYGKRKDHLEKVQYEKSKKIEQIKNEAYLEINELSDRDLFILGISLYWGEGFKKDNLVGFANSDPKMIRIFIFWLTKCLKIDISRLSLRVGINIFHQNRTKEIEVYWAKVTNLPLSVFKKAFYQKSINKKIYENPNEYWGTLRIRVSRSTDLLRKINSYIEYLKILSDKIS